ncbi:unnamed protein product [Oncorhynchus mykiss]|uniref:C2H2-type domain-containing protein n=1 Tax=Oncorhynchus mykiss TaxID=8022 RepID=A0A060YWH1_ONCMY|nr:unnamed protein product [Oncorhynchus mykiss]
MSPPPPLSVFYRFRQLPHLKDHERIHSGLRPFCCWVCGKAFSVAGRLTEHARIHSGETPYTCHRCPSAFRSRSNLDKHIRLHDDGTGGTTANDVEAEGARSAVQTILLVQADGTTEGVMVPAVPVSEQSSGAMFSGQAGSSQVVFLGDPLGHCGRSTGRTTHHRVHPRGDHLIEGTEEGRKERVCDRMY